MKNTIWRGKKKMEFTSTPFSTTRQESPAWRAAIATARPGRSAAHDQEVEPLVACIHDGRLPQLPWLSSEPWLRDRSVPAPSPSASSPSPSSSTRRPSPRPRVSFNMLHEKCKTRLKQQYICPKDDEVVTRDQMVQGLRVREGPVRRLHRGRAEGDGRGEQPGHRDHRVRAAREGRPDLLRGRLLPRARQGRRQRLHAPGRGHARDRALRARQVGRARQGLPRARPRRSTKGLVMQPLHYADEVRADRRGAGRRRAAEGRRAEAGRAARRPDLRPTSSAPSSTRTRYASGTTRPSSARWRARK